MNFKNKTVLITGASAGVGAACANIFAGLGANLVLVARGQDRLHAFAQTLSSSADVLTVAMDAGDLDACSELIRLTIEKFGSLHVVVNNAGLHTRGDFEKIAAEDVAAMIDVNLRTPLYLSSLALPYIKDAGEGSVVMVGSLAGRTPLQGAATYAATKAGLRAFTYSLADELRGTNIHFGVVSPGPISTEFILSNIDNVEDIVFSQPMSSAKQVAEAVLAVASGKCVERAMPWFSGKLTTISYLFPSLRHLLRSFLTNLGRKNKEKYR